MKVQAGLVMMSLIAMCSSAPIEKINPPLDDPIVKNAFDLLVKDFRSKGDYSRRKAVDVVYVYRERRIGATKYKVRLTVSRLDDGFTEECRVPYIVLVTGYPVIKLDGDVTCYPARS